MKDVSKYQMVIGYHTHEQTQAQYPIYGTDESPVPVREVHPSIEIGEYGLQISGLQMFVGNNCTYDDYIKIIQYVAQNPIKKEVFENTKKLLEEEVQNGRL